MASKCPQVFARTSRLNEAFGAFSAARALTKLKTESGPSASGVCVELASCVSSEFDGGHMS